MRNLKPITIIALPLCAVIMQGCSSNAKVTPLIQAEQCPQLQIPQDLLNKYEPKMMEKALSELEKTY